MDASIRQSWDSMVDILSRPQVWQLRHHSLIPGREIDFSLLQSTPASTGSYPGSCSVGMGVAWHEADHSCPFIVVLRVCVWSWNSTPLKACMHRSNFTDTRLLWTHWISFLSEEWLLHTYCWVHLASAIPGHKWQCFFFFELVAASFCGFVWTPVAFSAT